MTILYHRSMDPDELKIAQKYFTCTPYLSQCSGTVLARYSAVPFYKDTEAEINMLGGRLLNTYSEHQYIAHMDWAFDCLVGMTPKTYDSWYGLPEGQYIIKGCTTSKKHNWSTHMYCPTVKDIPIVASRLLDDQYISEQGLVVREYIPLKKLDEGVNGLPITNEYRTFWLVVGGIPKCLCSGFYWASVYEGEVGGLSQKAWEVLNQAAQAMAEHAIFFVLDIAETSTGDWIIIEVNDGQQSGLCGCDADELYQRLSENLVPPRWRS